MEDPKFDEIRQFCREKGLTDVNIEVKRQKSGGTRFKNEYYVSFTCHCMGKGCKKFKDLKHSPLCKMCIKAANPRTTDDVIKAQVEKNGHEFVKAEHIRGEKTRIHVTFICKCVISTTRVLTTQQWEVIKSISSCNICAATNRADSVRIAHAENGDIIREKIRNTMMERYGVEHPTQSEVIMEKIRTTNMERYGCSSPMQNSEVMSNNNRSRFKIKQYRFPYGRTVTCQGYEPLAYDILLEEIEEDDILVENDIINHSEIPQFWYVHNDKKHRYFPDICVWSQRKIIEVKSEWTATFKPEILKLKRESVISSGFLFEMWIFDKKEQLVRRE